MTLIRVRHDTSTDWTADNPILKSGEPGFATDTGTFKVGNGISRWSDLSPIGGSPTVYVADFAVGNANYLSGGIWYADAAHTIVATDDTAAIRALVAAGATNLDFGNKGYRIQWTQQTSFLSWANANGVTIRGEGATLCDTGTYTVSPTNPYTPVFELDACTNFSSIGVAYYGPAIVNPTVNHGYVGATFVRAKNGCDSVVVDAQITNCRYGVESGAYPTPSEGYNTNFNTRLRCSFVAYPQAHYLAEGIRFDIDADDVHRVSYLAGCIDAIGIARWSNEYVADTCFLITDALTGSGPQTSRACSDIDIKSIDKGSTVFQASTACAGIGLSRVNPMTYQNIKIGVSTTSTDTISSTVGLFKLYSGAAVLTTPPAPFNWEPSIAIRNLTVYGVGDHSAQTIDGNTAGDLFIRAWDTSAAHAATMENIELQDLVVKPSSGNTRGLYFEAPYSGNTGLLLKNVQAPGYVLNVYTDPAVPLIFKDSSIQNIAGESVVPRIILDNSFVTTLSGTVGAVENINSYVTGGGCFIRTKTILLNLAGATVVWTNALPAGCIPLGLSGRITQLITGATGVQVGVGTDPSRYLNTNTLTAGFTFGPANYSPTEQTLWWIGASALNINVTAKTSNFTAGQIRLVLTYIEFPAPTS